MNLTVGFNTAISRNNKPSFKMAKFSQNGLSQGLVLSRQYDIPNFEQVNTNADGDFYGRYFLKEAPFTTYIKKTFASGAKSKGEEEMAEKTEKVTKKIVQYGAKTNNKYAAARFIKQLLSSEDCINEIGQNSEYTQRAIAAATFEVFLANWNNPEVSDKQTAALLEMSKPAIEPGLYLSCRGLLDHSDKNIKRR